MPQSSGQQVNAEAVLSRMASQSGGGGNWNNSIVDLLKLLNLDSSLTARRQLANELNIHVAGDGSAEENRALHKAVIQKLAENGGKVPVSMLAWFHRCSIPGSSPRARFFWFALGFWLGINLANLVPAQAQTNVAITNLGGTVPDTSPTMSLANDGLPGVLPAGMIARSGVSFSERPRCCERQYLKRWRDRAGVFAVE
jgi:hypothetical protein